MFKFTWILHQHRQQHQTTTTTTASSTTSSSSSSSSSHQFLTPAIWRRWVRMNDLSLSFVKSIAPLNVSPIDSCPHLYERFFLYIEVWVCLCVFYLCILHVDT